MESACRWGIVGSVALIAVALGPTAVAAQSDLDASEAQEFLGTWQLPLQTDMGRFDIELLIEDQGGKVAVTVGSIDMGSLSVTDVTRDGEALVLDYDVDAQGQMIPIRMELTRVGEDLSIDIDAASGQFTARGKATRSAG